MLLRSNFFAQIICRRDSETVFEVWGDRKFSDWKKAANVSIESLNSTMGIFSKFQDFNTKHYVVAICAGVLVVRYMIRKPDFQTLFYPAKDVQT